MNKTLGKRITVIIGAIILVVVGLAVGKIIFTPNTVNDPKNIIKIEEQAQDWNPENVDMKSDDAGIQIPGYGDIYVPAYEKNIQITLFNPNKNNCYFKFDLYVDDDLEPIYSTNYIEPGKAVKNLSLKKSISLGDHTLKIIISTYDIKNNKKLNGAEINAKLYAI